MSDQTSAKPMRQPVPICAIGASAGGVVALQSLFSKLPSNLGLTYIAIMHLQPGQQSVLHELIGAVCKMPTIQVEVTTELLPDHVYVIPPAHALSIQGQQVKPAAPSTKTGVKHPIDTLFSSMAKERGDGIAVLMTGAGSDGTHGIRAVKEAGGIVIVQDPNEAEYRAMPQSAIETGDADFIEPISQIAKIIIELAHSKAALARADEDSVSEGVRQIIKLTQIRTGHDFSIYKEGTVIRRIRRRAQINQCGSIEEYLTFFRSHPVESKLLFDDLLISVTSFFRDRDAFERLDTEVIAPLVENADETIRVWSAGCASGEEAYSIAMLLREQAERQQSEVEIQIFATDLDEDALARARLGVYPRSIENDVSQARLKRFFIDEGSHYRIGSEVREIVLFAPHSIVRDPPFLRIDLVVCRNVLIYFARRAQQQIASIFRYCLKQDGYLFIGPAEAPDIVAGAFQTIDREMRIYRARSSAAPAMPFLPKAISPSNLPRDAGRRLKTVSTYDARDLLGTAHLAALEENAPPSVLIDAERRVLNSSPSVGRFMQVPGGPPTDKLPSLVRSELRGELMIALDRAFQTQQPIIARAAEVSFDTERRQVLLHIAILPAAGGATDRALISFLDGGIVDQSDEPASASPLQEEVRRLRVDLSAAQQAALISRAEHETALQDLRVANEELQSLNEEYRSTAEELETSKEELQSVNEELHTVNAELRTKVNAVTTAHNDLLNLTTSSEIGTLFLDPDLKIRMFTPPIAKLFSVSEVDVGRSITDFSHRLSYGDLAHNVRQVLQSGEPIEEEIRGPNDRWLLLRIRPYRTVENKVSGVVVTLNDITESEARLRAFVVASTAVVYRMSADWSEMIRLEGRDFLADTNTPSANWMDGYIPAEDQDAVKAAIAKAIEEKGLFDLEHRVRRRDGSLGWTRSRALPVLGKDGSIIEWLGTAIDAADR